MERPSVLVIGKNGSGKSTLRQALGVFQKICRGPNQEKEWIEVGDFAQQRKHIPMRFEIDLNLAGKRVKYVISFEMSEQLRDARVSAESLAVDGNTVFSREQAQVTLTLVSSSSAFGLDRHVAALPLIDESFGGSALREIKSFLASMILIAPSSANA